MLVPWSLYLSHAEAHHLFSISSWPVLQALPEFQQNKTLKTSHSKNDQKQDVMQRSKPVRDIPRNTGCASRGSYVIAVLSYNWVVSSCMSANTPEFLSTAHMWNHQTLLLFSTK